MFFFQIEKSNQASIVMFFYIFLDGNQTEHWVGWVG